MCGVVGSVSLGFLADAFGRKTATMLFYLMCLILTPVVYLSAQEFTSCCSASACSASSSWGSGPGRRYGSPISSRPECVGPRSLQCATFRRKRGPADCRHPDRGAWRLRARGRRSSHRSIFWRRIVLSFGVPRRPVRKRWLQPTFAQGSSWSSFDMGQCWAILVRVSVK